MRPKSPWIADKNTPNTTGQANPTEPEADLSNDAPLMTNELTTFQDQTPQEIAITPSTQIPISDPYPDQGMNQVCQRLMKVDNFAWASSDVQGTIIGFVDFPSAILQFDSMWCRMSRFRFFRSDLEIQVRVNTTKFHYGQLMCFVVPDTTADEVAALATDIWTASQLEPKLLLANSATELTFTIPYQHQMDYIDLKTVSSEPCSLAKIVFIVLTPLKSASSNADDSLDVTVWGRFTNFHICGPVSTALTPPTPKEKYKKLVLETHRGKKINQFNMKVPTPESEQDTRSATGTTSDIGARIKNFAASFTKVPIIGGIASAASAVGGLLSDIGLDKPNNLRIPEKMFVDPSSSLMQGKGLDMSTNLSLNPKAYVSDDQAIFGKVDPACYSFRALAQKPSLYETREILSSTAAGTIIAKYPLGPYPKFATPSPLPRFDTWYAASARQFLFWRGSTKYMFVFSASSYTTARFRLTYHPDSTGANAEAQNGGDVISMIIDVKGDTITKVTIPYLSKKPYERVPFGDTYSSSESTGTLDLSLVNRIIDFDSTVSDSAIQLSVWVAAGEDIEYSVPYFPRTPPVSEKKTEVKPEGDICDVFKSSFTPIIKASSMMMRNYVTSETEMSIKTYLHRYYYTGGINSSEALSVTTPYPPYGSTWTEQPIWAWFRFKRGSMRFRFNRNSPTSMYVGYTAATDGVVDPVLGPQNYVYNQIPDGSDQNNTFVTLPYAATARFLKSAASASNRGVTYLVPYYLDTSGARFSFAAGDDISFGGLGTTPTFTS